MLDELKNKRILILGFGREGRDTFKFLRKLFPKKIIGIADKSQKIKKPDKKIRLYLGINYLKSLKKYDVIIKAPGIPFKILPKSQLPNITGQTEIFFENCPGRIVGITGTKGKSTTTSLIYEVLKKGGIKAHLIGNIEKPVLNLLFSAKSDNVYVYELSSFQLANLKKSPHVAVFLNIYPEHLDYHKNFKEYVNAKANIVRYQTEKDYLVFNVKDKLVNKLTKKTKAKKIPIQGKYYSLNKNAAKATGKIFKIPEAVTDKVVNKFKNLPYRLEYVGKFREIKFYNDALATIPEATIAALNILGDNVETIFLGGFDRGLDFKNLAKRILKSKIKNLILFPTTGEKIWKEIIYLKKNNKFRFFLVQNMKDAVKLSYQHTRKGKICLLSTASASFSIFKDYKEKGDLFKKYVKFYGKKT